MPDNARNLIQKEISKPQTAKFYALRFNSFNPFKITFKLAALLLLGIISFRLASYQIANWLNQMGYEKYVSQQYGSAEFYYRWAIIFNHDFGIARYGLGAACEELENFVCAYSEYEIASQSQDNRAASLAINNLARMYIVRDKKYDVAINLVLSGLNRSEEVKVKSALYKNLGEAYLKKNNPIKAEDSLNNSIRLEGKHADAYCLLAEVKKKLGDKKEAKAALESCLKYTDENNPNE